MTRQPWHDPDAPEQTPAGRLRELLRQMHVPAERVQPLDLAWLAEHLGDYSARSQYVESRLLCVQLLGSPREAKRRLRRR